MTDEVPTRARPMLDAAGNVTRLAGMVGALSLSSAILFNVIRFAFLDASLLTAFTISDHVATAVETLPYVLAIAALIFWPFRSKAQTFGDAWRFLAIGAGAGLVGFAVLLLVWPGYAAQWLGLNVAMSWLMGGDYLVGRWLLTRFDRRDALAGRMLAAIAVMTVYFGISAGAGEAIARPRHVLTLKDGTTVEGSLVQIIERGVVFVAPSSNGAVFIQRDQYQKIQRK